MKKIFTLILIGFLFLNCSDKEDDGFDCSLIDPMSPELFIRLIDENGENLIENGTFNPDEITVEGNFSYPSFLHISANEFGTEYNNTLLLDIPNQSKFEYTINLNNTTSILLEFDAKFTNGLCIDYYLPTKVAYNNQDIELETEEYSLNLLVEIKL